MGKGDNIQFRLYVTRETAEAVKIAAAYRGMSMLRYADIMLFDVARRDIEEGHQAWSEREGALRIMGGEKEESAEC